MPHHRPDKWRESFRLSNSRVPLSPLVWTSHAHIGRQRLRLRRDFECNTCGMVCLWQTKETVRKIVCLRFTKVATTKIELRITHLTETCPARHDRFCRNRRRRDHTDTAVETIATGSEKQKTIPMTYLLVLDL